MKKMISPFLSVFFLLFIHNCMGQQVKGKVLSESGFAASHVSVSFKNKSNSVVTNVDGTFTIDAKKLPDTLVFSAPGYEPYSVVVTDKNIKDPNFEIVLLNSRRTLDEVVTVGYAATKRKDITGSVSSLKGESFRETTSSAAVALRGKVSGLTISDDRSIVRNRTRSFYMSDSTISRDSTLAASQILTAGEINDFYKWKMWEDLTVKEFKTLSDYWGFYLKQRYTVQLQNKDFFAIINQPVYLIDKNKGDTVWSAITDNTGKAELWADINSESISGKEFIIRSVNGLVNNNPVPFSKGINHFTTNINCGASNIVDIAFVVDATGSMGDEINFLKLELEDVIRKTHDKYTDLNVRVGSVFYRDKGDEYVTKHIDFQTDLLKVLNFVKLQSDGGGGDTPEAVDSALDVALNKLSWSKEARTRLLFLVLDAPPHDYAKKDIQKLVTRAASMGVRIIPLACSGSDKSNEFLLRSMALATNGSYAFLTDHSGVGEAHTAPTTDKYDVELLNSLLQRLIQQFIYVKDCTGNEQQKPVTHQPENEAKVIIYPNPTSGNFTIETNKDIREMYIADFAGKILMKLAEQNKKGRWKADITRYPSGTYFVRYITKDNKIGAEKVVLVH